MPRASLAHTRIIRDGECLNVSVLYEANHPTRGARGLHGQPLEPDEPGLITILSTWPNDLSDAELKALEQVIAEEEGLA